MQFIDTHSHLCSDAFNDDREAVIERMKADGMIAAVVIGCEAAELDPVCQLVQSHPGFLYGAWAVHPEFPDHPEVSVEALAEVASRPGMVAVGETGLDFYWCKEPLDWQRARFRTHIEAAKLVNKPLIVHARDSEAAALDILEETHAGDVGFVLHCYSADKDTALRAVAAGGHVSFTGSLTFKRNDALREVCKAVPLSRLMLETDCPYMAPVPLRGKRCEPQYVRHIAQCMADIRGLTLADVARATTDNALRFFRLPLSSEV